MRQICSIWGSHLGGFNLIWGLHLYPLTSSMCFSMLVSISFIGYIRCVWGRKILRSLILIFCQNLWNIVQAPKRTPSSLLLGTQVSHHTPGPGPLTPSLPGKPAVNFDPCLDTVKFGLKIVDSIHVFEQSQCFWPIFRYPKSCSESKRFRSPGSSWGLLFWP